MRIDINYFENIFNKITSISATEIGCTRISFSKEDDEVRQLLLNEFENLNLDIKTDFLGNILAIYNPLNSDEKLILTGSHIDTVKSGGKYDGLVGVVSALTCVHSMKREKLMPKRPIGIVIFSEEEGSNFGVTMIGSKFTTGRIDKEYLLNLKNEYGDSAFDVISKKNYAPFESNKIIDTKTQMGMIETHIEQGAVLDNINKSIGIVTSIAGMKTLKIRILGESNHAGTTPMNMRKDPVVTAAKIISDISSLPEKLNMETAVLTVGFINVTPNGSNVIASEIEFNVDIRDIIQENIETLTEEVKKYTINHSNNSNIDYSIKIIGSSDVVDMDSGFIDVIKTIADSKNLDYNIMHSGAVHDNAMLYGLLKIGMIFVPSIKGISHSPMENTKMEDIYAGCDLLLDVLLNI